MTALDALLRGEIQQLRIGILATTLNVTKGSFYWHFQSWQAFVESLLEYWLDEFTENVPVMVSELGGTPEERLFAVAETITGMEAGRFDVAMHSWALQNEAVAKAVAKVEDARLKFVRSLFAEMGFEGEGLEMRVRTFVVFYSFESGLRKGLSKAERLRHLKRRHAMLVKGP